MRSAVTLAFAAVAAAALGGCYQSFGAGYAYMAGEDEPHAFEGSWLLAIQGEGSDEPGVYGKLTVMGGGSGVRGADVLGAVIMTDLDPGMLFFRPGLAFFVIGAAPPPDNDLWIGIGIEGDLGFMFEIEDETFLEVGVRAGGDLSYSGFGGGGFFGAFLGIGWWWDGPDMYTR